MAQQVCGQIDRQQPTTKQDVGETKDRLTFVEDRPGHDKRYALDCSKMQRLFGWQATTSFEDGMAATVEWYLRNPKWLETVCHAYEGRRIGLR